MDRFTSLPHQAFEDIFRRETSALILERSRTLIWSGLFLFLSFWFLDYFVAGEHAGVFLKIRLAVAAVNIPVLVALYSRFAPRYAMWFAMTGALAAGISIAVMTTYLGGFTSNYFVGIMIVLVAVPLIVPMGLWPTLLMSLTIIASYVGLNLMGYGASTELLPPLFFLMCMTAFSCVATLSQERTRRRDLSLRSRLEQANRELTELDEAKTRLFANVSHELRTPLTLVIGPLQGLVREETNSQRRRALQAMIENSRRLLRQVDALLDVAKLQSGQLRLQPQHGDLGDLLHSLITAARPHAATRGIEIVEEQLDRLPRFPFDVDKAEMIAANLISNALKFTLPGGTIRVRGSLLEDSVVFEVEDNGIGIPEDQLDQVFERFHQVDSSTSRSREGTGLGLALAKELAQLHGGDISVESRVDAGSTFRVELPLDPPVEPAERRRAPRRREDRFSLARVKAIKAHEFSNRARRSTLLADIVAPDDSVEEPRISALPDSPSLLIVEDNVDLRNFVAQELAQRYTISTASDGKEALEHLKRDKFDLVVADVMMPVMDGYELCRRIRENPRLRSLPVILVTAKAGEEAVIEGLEVGADDYVTKPFDLRELEARISAHLRAKLVERKLFERDTRLAAIGRMTNNLVQDLRNPLTLIVGHADLARMFVDQNEEPDLVGLEIEGIQDAANRLRQRMEEILEYSRGGTPEVQGDEVAARELLDTLVPPLLDELAGWNISHQLDNQVSSDAMMQADPDRLERVLENLISNARESVRDQEDKRVTVRCKSENHRLEIAVSDTGPMPAGTDLFEPGQSPDAERSRSLALATVKNLVRAHGGAVEAEADAELGGKVVRIFLPLTHQETPPVVTDPDGKTAPETAKQAGTPSR